jgi:hypothetical protein
LWDEFTAKGFGEKGWGEPMVYDRPWVIDLLTSVFVLRFNPINSI